MAIGSTNPYTKNFDNGIGILFIEPKKPKTFNKDVDFVANAEKLFTLFQQSNYYYKGVHICSCRTNSDNRDYYLVDKEVTYVTNSLFMHYIKEHHTEIPAEELALLNKLIERFVVKAGQSETR